MFPNKDPAGSDDAESRTTPPSSGSGKKKVTIASFDKGCNRKKVLYPIKVIIWYIQREANSRKGSNSISINKA